MRRLCLLLAFALTVAPAGAGLTLSPGTVSHTHADANTGGSVLLPTNERISGSGLNDCAGFTPQDATCESLIVTSLINADASPNPPNGSLEVYNPNASATVLINSGPGGENIKLARNNILRYSITSDNSTETGSNAGSNLLIKSFSDTGTLIGLPLQITRATSLVSIIGTLSSSKACATGFTRIGPNFCKALSSASQVVSTGGNCVQSTAMTGVTDAKAGLFQITSVVNSTNVLNADDQVELDVFAPTDATCASFTQHQVIYAVHEFAALAAGTQIGKKTDQAIWATDSNGRFYAKSTATTGVSTVQVYVVGYFD